MYFQSLIDTIYLLYVNIIENNLEIGDWVKSVERFHNNEGEK